MCAYMCLPLQCIEIGTLSKGRKVARRGEIRRFGPHFSGENPENSIEVITKGLRLDILEITPSVAPGVEGQCGENGDRG